MINRALSWNEVKARSINIFSMIYQRKVYNNDNNYDKKIIELKKS